MTTTLTTVITMDERGMTIDDVNAIIILAMHERAAVEKLTLTKHGKTPYVTMVMKYADGVGEAELADVIRRIEHCGLTLDPVMVMVQP